MASTALVAGMLVTGVMHAADAAGSGAVQDLAGCRANSLAANDDGSTALVPLGFPIRMNGVEHSEVYVNNNGNVSFDKPYYEYTPFDFTATGSIMFAPFLADVDTRAGNVVTYGQTSVAGAPAFCVNWIGVGYFAEHIDKTNSFQLLIINRGNGDFDLVYNYDQIQWETGDASQGDNGLGGTSAAVGHSSGDGVPETNVMLPGSFVNGALLDGGAQSLVGHGTGAMPGRYVTEFRDNGTQAGTVHGVVRSGASGAAEPVSGVSVQLCDSAGLCRVVFSGGQGQYTFARVPAGTYTVTTGATGYYEGSSRTVTVNSGAGDYVLDLTMGAALTPLPSGWFTDGNSTESDVPITWTNQPTTVTSPPMCDGAGTWEVRARNTVLASGVLTKTPDPDNPGKIIYSATVPPLTANVGVARVFTVIRCVGGRSAPLASTAEADDIVEEFSLFVNPAIRVLDSAGATVSGAQVTLERAAEAGGSLRRSPWIRRCWQPVPRTTRRPPMPRAWWVGMSWPAITEWSPNSPTAR
ncbi:MAG: nidogen-like domain-containing protein [Nocardioides sp.]